MIRRDRPTWTLGHTVLLSLLAALTAWAFRHPLADIVSLGLNDEEQSHIFLAPIVALWLLWLRRSRLRFVGYRPNLLGPAIVAGSWLLSWWGFEQGVQVAWHGGAVLAFIGIVITCAGTMPLRLLAPVFAVLIFALPVPGGIRHQIAYPLQAHATDVTHAVLEVIGVSVVKSGNVIVINGEQVAVGEACNGMRLVFALTLVVYAFAFGTPLRPTTRAIVLGLSPVIAMICNVIRLVPTSLIYGYGDVEWAHRFHDVAGWVMLPVALLALMGVVRMIKWLEFPVTSYRLANHA